MNLAPPTPGTTWRWIRLAVHPDPLAHITSAIDATRLADQVLTGAFVAHAGTRMWSSVAIAPLAALMLTASAVGTAEGMSWVRTTSSALHHAATWDRTRASCTQPRSVTLIMVTAAGPRPRREGVHASRRETSPRPR